MSIDNINMASEDPTQNTTLVRYCQLSQNKVVAIIHTNVTVTGQRINVLKYNLSTAQHRFQYRQF